MSDYTPTVEDMCDAYVIIRASGDPGHLPFGSRGEAEAKAEFHSGIAAHDAEVREQCAREIERGCIGQMMPGAIEIAAHLIREGGQK
jgi:hypothetical protein